MLAVLGFVTILLLPSHRKEAEEVVKYVYDTYKDQAAIRCVQNKTSV